MNIFVDEAGTFSVARGRKWSISCIGSLVITEKDTTEILSKFKKLRQGWGSNAGEIKGSNLNEPEISSVITFLSGYDLIFQVTAVDMRMQYSEGLTKHRMNQAKRITKHITKNHKPALFQSFLEIQKQLRNLSNQLYVQAVCTSELLYKVIQKATLYYAQRRPEELAEFYWTIDAKDQKITPYEELWTKIICPMLQTKSFKEPFIQLTEADYSYFSKYFGSKLEPPEHLKSVASGKKPFDYVEIKEIYQRNLRFEQSDKNYGLQIIDILTNAIRRAMNGNLQISGWSQIGKLMVKSERGSQVIQLINFSGKKPIDYKGVNPPYWKVIPIIERTCKPMLKGD